MKQILSSLAIAALAMLASCRSYDPSEADTVRNDGTGVQSAQEATIDSLKLELAKLRIVDSMSDVARLEKEAALTALGATAATTTRSTPARSTRNRRSSSSSNYSSYTGSGYTAPAPAPQPVYQEAPAPAQKRGWSAKAKGAVIGAGTGAVSGAVINKRNRAAGAVIGGVLGAGVGTGVGAVIDRKNGR